MWAITLAYEDYYDFARIVLSAGLNVFPNSADLLADYLVYGVKCERRIGCDKYYKRMQEIPRNNWTWRAYDFSIDYLLTLSNYEVMNEVEQKRIVELINEFKQNFLENELPYMAEASYYNYLKKHDSELSVLNEAVNKIKVTPRCSLYLARIYFDKGLYRKANELLENCKVLSTHIFSSSQIGRIYILSALCEIALYYLEANESDELEKEYRAKKIYSDYKAASKTRERTSKEFNELMVIIDVFSEKSDTTFYDM